MPYACHSPLTGFKLVLSKPSVCDIRAGHCRLKILESLYAVDSVLFQSVKVYYLVTHFDGLHNNNRPITQ